MPMRPDAGPKSFSEPARNIGRRSRCPEWPSKRAFLTWLRDRHPLHGARDEHHLAVGGNDQQMRREIAEMVEAGQIEDVFRRRDQEDVKAARTHLRPDSGEPGVELGAQEVWRRVAEVRVPLPLVGRG